MKYLTSILISATVLSASGYQPIEDASGLVIKTPSLSERQTAKIRLDNGLEAYLISDPNTDQSAAALAVGVGQWSDPVEYPGTAHFVEHMLFLGNETYPEEDAFSRNVTDAGGMWNAYTACDRTVYMFSCTNDALTPLIDEFAHFFIDPLMRESSIGRELLAVNQENEKNKENDGWRGWMIFKETGNQDHPNARFSTGNADTLGTIPVTTVKQWFDDHYSSEHCHLVLYSNRSIDELTTMAITHFGAIPKRKGAHVAHIGAMTSEQQRGHITYITPVRDLRTLSLLWEVPEPLGNKDETKTMELIAYCLSSKGEKSIFATLNAEGLVEGLSSSTDTIARNATLFSLDISLTPKGVEELDRVIDTCFEAISSLKEAAIPPYLFKEIATMAELDYEFQGRENAFSFVTTAAGGLVNEPIETYPRQTLMPLRFDRHKVTQGLSLLTPEACVYTVVAPSHLTGITPDHKEKWLGGHYSVVPLDEKRLTFLANIDPNPRLGAPAANPFIPVDLQAPGAETSTPIEEALLASTSDKGTLYYAPDTYYHVPEVSWIVNLKSPLIDDTPDQTALLDLYVIALRERLSAFLSDARRAGIAVSFSHADYALQIDLNGYAQKAPELFDVITYGLRTVEPSPEAFARYKTRLLSAYENRMMAMPFQTANEIAAGALYNNANQPGALHSALQDISYEEFLTYAKALPTKAYLEATVSGALSQAEAQETWTKLETGLGYTPFEKENHFTKEVLAIGSPYRIDAATNMQGNAALLVVQQAPFSYQKKASQVVLAPILRMAFFETLRTKQQTGYIAKGWPREVSGKLMQCFAVQSTSHEPNELIARFELFLEELVRDFDTHVPEQRFEAIRSQLVTTLSTPATNLSERVAELHELAYTHNGAFERTNRLIEAIKALTYDQLTADARNFFSRKNKARLAVELEGAPSEGSALRYETVSSDRLRREGVYTAAAT